MGQLLGVLTYDRNTLKESELASIAAVQRAIEAVRAGRDLTADKGLSNIRGACASYLGLFRRNEQEEFELTDVGRWYLRLHEQRGTDAWRWLLTRSLWRYVLPNGTATPANAVAKDAGLQSFQFFRLIIRMLAHLSGEPRRGRFLSYEEFCMIFNSDENWHLDAPELVSTVFALRGSRPYDAPELRLTRKFIDDLENEYTPGKRDNLNTWFNKAFAQTGLFEYAKAPSGADAGIALKAEMDPVLLRRVRFIIDNPVSWSPEE